MWSKMICNQRIGRRDAVTDGHRGWCLRRCSSCFLLLILVATTLRTISGIHYQNCTKIVASIADAICDIDNNIQDCGYDGGDCCPSTCTSTDSVECTSDTRECLNPKAIDYPYAEVANCSGMLRYINDSICDRDINNAECGYDGGDCCPSTCDNSLGFCLEEPTQCLDPDAEDLNYANTSCTGYMPSVGNGRCNENNNNADCDYDGGDCCECTCVSEFYSCTDFPFNCVDPSVMENGNDECNQVTPCSKNTTEQVVVRNTTDVLELTRSIQCSGGVFSVEWIGHIVVNETIWVTDQTTLIIKGVGVNSSTAIADGNDTTQIIGVKNATLHLENMYLIRGFTFSGILSIDSGNVTLRGEAAFINNTSISTGAINVNNGGSLSSDGNLTFINNSGKRHAGAITALSSNVSLRGNTTFEGNSVDGVGRRDGKIYGGAIYASNQSRVSWSGHTTFINNYVAGTYPHRRVFGYGGAVAADLNSSVSWTGRTYFVRNKAVSGGGALFASNMASFSWEKNETFFIGNTAKTGGAILLNGTSNASWSGATTFESNEADVGGALSITEQSKATWTSATTFSSNTAELDGGAVYVRNKSEVKCQGVTMFEKNAASEGGGLYIEDGSEIVLNNLVVFSGNIAKVQGGAVYVVASTRENDATYVCFNASTRFFNNSGGTYGGALMVSGSITFLIGYGVLEFEGNRAGSTGGAVLLTDVGKGPTFHGSKFVANKAEIGGAVYATGTGTSMSARGGSFPLTFDGCNFTGNEATSTGGAVESIAGHDSFVNTHFINNVAEEGGALRLAGTSSILGCHFERNHAAEKGGPAIHDIGFTKAVASSSFIKNDFDCDAGYFLNSEKGDRYPFVCSGCSKCNNCTLDDNSSYPTCEQVLEHTESSGGGVTLDMLHVNPGYWRATPTSRKILECYNQDACSGGLTGSADFCAAGYEGPYCAVCSHGYTESLSYTCRICSDYRATIVTWLMSPSIITLALLFLGYMVSKERRSAKRVCLKRLRKLPLQSIKIVIVAWQIITELASVTSISFPREYKIFLEGVTFFNFDIGLVLSAGCFIDVDFHGRLIMATLGPIVVIGMLALTYKIAMRRNSGSLEAIEIVRGKHVSMVLWITFLVYSSVSSIIFQTFSCETLDDGENYLRADYSILCTSSKHKNLQTYAAFMILLYPVGIPLAYVSVLYFSQDALKASATQTHNNLYVKAASQLSSPYQPGCFYYEVIECVRRVTLTGAIVFVLPYEMGQVAVTLILIMMFALCTESLAPYRSSWETWISRLGDVVIFLSVFAAFIVTYFNYGRDGRVNEKGFGRALVATNLCWIVAVVVEGVTMVCSDIPMPDNLPRMVSKPQLSESFRREVSDSDGIRVASEATIDFDGKIERYRFRQGKSLTGPRLE